MKILVLQLARLGDIYMTWPALRALRRTNPSAQIDVMVRPRFAAALDGLTEISNIVELPTLDLIAPLLEGHIDIEQAEKNMSWFVQSVKSAGYDWIINLSYSPFSSFLTHALCGEGTKVTGYTRHADGHLNIPDDMSAYFYAQVGIEKHNRFHLTDIFAEAIGIPLEEQDWRGPDFIDSSEAQFDVILHIGASEKKKALSPVKWTAMLNHYLKYRTDRIALIGASNEVPLAEEIMNSINSDLVTNLVGKTNLRQVFNHVAKAQILVGCDSAPMHMATLTNTPCLNISLNAVNFWETGPRSVGSVIVQKADENDIISDEIADYISKMLRGNNLPGHFGLVTQRQISPAYELSYEDQHNDQWNFIKSIYTGDQFSAFESETFIRGLTQLREVNEVFMSQLNYLADEGLIENVAGIIDRCEEVIDLLGKVHPNIKILVDWYQTEKLRIAPSSQAEIVAKNLAIHALMQSILDLYHSHYSQPTVAVP